LVRTPETGGRIPRRLASGVAEARRLARERGLLPLRDEDPDASEGLAATAATRRRRARDHADRVARRAFPEQTAGAACALCRKTSAEDASCPGYVAGELLAFERRGGGGPFWIHDGCAAASAEVRVVDDVWFDVEAAARRGRLLKCAACGKPGATLGCIEATCRKSFHPRCACDRERWDVARHAPAGFYDAADAARRDDDLSDGADSSDDDFEGSPFEAFACLDHRPRLPPPPPACRVAHCTRRWPGFRPRIKPRPLGAPRRPEGFVDDDGAPKPPPPPPRGDAPRGKPRHALLAVS